MPSSGKPPLTEGKTRSNIKVPKEGVPRPPPPPPGRVIREDAPGAETFRTLIRLIREWRKNDARKED